MDISKYIKEIDEEILGQKEEIVRRMVEKTIQNFVFNEKNISSSLINLLMQTASISIPVPEIPEVPSAMQSSADEFAFLQDSPATSIFTDLMVGNNVYLFGKAGTGKTFLAKQIVKVLLQREDYVINCNQFTSPIDIIGGQTIEGYKQGRLCQAWQNGGVLILDELPKLDPNTAGLLNEALAESSGTPSRRNIDADEYKKFKQMKDDAGGRELGFDLIEENGNYVRIDYPTITDGRGVKLRKNKNFACIGTGNTNLKETSTNFTGNNRQDYSLVDRFAGSFYEISYNLALEDKIIYPVVLKVCRTIRQFLDDAQNSVESVSLRTLLNMNRIYEQEGLRVLRSKYAVPPIFVNGIPEAKTFLTSINSFVDTLPTAVQDLCRQAGVFSDAADMIDPITFTEQWYNIHGQENSPEPNTATWQYEQP